VVTAFGTLTGGHSKCINVMFRWTAVLKGVPCDCYIPYKLNQHRLLVVLINLKILASTSYHPNNPRQKPSRHVTLCHSSRRTLDHRVKQTARVH